AGRLGRFGQGVLVAPLAALVGLDLDAVVVVGVSEGTCPAPRRDDALVSDADRLSAEPAPGELIVRRNAVHDEHRRFMAALAAGGRHRVLIQARGDHRSGHHRLPSRWLLDAATHLVGAAVYSSDLDDIVHPAIVQVASSVDGLRTAARPATPDELDLQLLVRHCDEGRAVADHPLASHDPVASGLALQTARSSASLTRFDGYMPGVTLAASPLDAIQSPTRLETYAECPFRYLLVNVLRLSEAPEPEDLLSIDALSRGHLVHTVLERFLLPVIDEPPHLRPQPGTPWPPHERARLRSIALDVFADFEAKGLTGRPMLWRVERGQILEMLDDWLTDDDGLRQKHGSVPEALEMAFGLSPDVGPLEVALGDGRTVLFRGRADRVDRTVDGGTLVLDYKTGKDSYKASKVDPLRGGKKLQLAVYGLAARQRYGGVAKALYWFLAESGQARRRGYTVDDAIETTLATTVRTMVDGIEAGVFPAVPGEEDWFSGTNKNCRYCAFDSLCPRDRLATFEAKQDDPALAGYLSLGAEVTQ
ncbi:MAG TPA: PD-(D/E)XK nuclease family protein, partial [Acidimicrobiales bacterium]